MEEYLKDKLSDLGVSDFESIDDEYAEDDSTIRRWMGRDEKGRDVTVEFYEDEFLDVWFYTGRPLRIESLYSDWI